MNSVSMSELTSLVFALTVLACPTLFMVGRFAGPYLAALGLTRFDGPEQGAFLLKGTYVVAFVISGIMTFFLNLMALDNGPTFMSTGFTLALALCIGIWQTIPAGVSLHAQRMAGAE